MQFLRSVFIIATFAYPVLCAVLPNTHVLHEKRDHLASAWVKRDRVQRNAILPIRIGLSQSNLHKGDDLLMQVFVFSNGWYYPFFNPG
jgi:tripeptidyl-peptidase-1